MKIIRKLFFKTTCALCKKKCESKICDICFDYLKSTSCVKRKEKLYIWSSKRLSNLYAIKFSEVYKKLSPIVKEKEKMLTEEELKIFTPFYKPNKK